MCQVLASGPLAATLYAKAVVFSDGTRKVCIVSVDVTIITNECSSRIRRAASALGFDPAAVMVHATQTHTAPALGNSHLDPDALNQIVAKTSTVLRGMFQASKAK